MPKRIVPGDSNPPTCRHTAIQFGVTAVLFFPLLTFAFIYSYEHPEDSGEWLGALLIAALVIGLLGGYKLAEIDKHSGGRLSCIFWQSTTVEAEQVGAAATVAGYGSMGETGTSASGSDPV